MYERITASRERRARRRRKRIIVFFSALVVLVILLVGIYNPDAFGLPYNLSEIILLAKQEFTMPEETPTYQKITETLLPTQTSTQTISPEQTATQTKQSIIASKTPLPTIKILTGLPDGTVYMRQGPSLKFRSTRILHEDDQMTFFGCSSDWAMIKIDDQTGYVYSKYTTANCNNQEK